MHRASLNTFCKRLGVLENRSRVMKLACLMLQKHPLHDMKNSFKSCTSKSLYGLVVHMEAVFMTLYLRALLGLSKVFGTFTLPMLTMGLDHADAWVVDRVEQFESQKDPYAWFDASIVVGHAFEERLEVIKHIYDEDLKNRTKNMISGSSAKRKAKEICTELNICPLHHWQLSSQVYMATEVHYSSECVHRSIRGFWKNTRVYEISFLVLFYVWMQYPGPSLSWWKTLGIVLFMDVFCRITRIVLSSLKHLVLLHSQEGVVKCLYEAGPSSLAHGDENKRMRRFMTRFKRVRALKRRGEIGLAFELYVLLALVYVMQFEVPHIHL